jgi:hypothetical protein
MMPEKLRLKTLILGNKNNLHNCKKYMYTHVSLLMYDKIFDAKLASNLPEKFPSNVKKC